MREAQSVPESPCLGNPRSREQLYHFPQKNLDGEATVSRPVYSENQLIGGKE